MSISKQELAQGIRFAGQRAVAAGRNCKNWDHQLAHQWTTRDAFTHIAAVAGGAKGLYPLLDAGVLNGFNVDAAAASNQKAIEGLSGKTQDELLAAIIEGHEASAQFVESLDEADLAKVVTLGGYEMSKAELVAQIWIHHPIAHAYEASARWPLL
ncbi:MAG: maleylpyruvate isomerase N-terminal domain-containing protein [Dehalococcoidia bacterium]|nr:maleylpyruvate isomerase N-terminal domain-containing protein [Dehalococcoidia bacterium]